MTQQQLINTLDECGFTDSTFFTDPDYADAILGISTDGRVVYSFKRMVRFLMDETTTEAEAIDAVRYNAVDMLDMMGEKSPVIVNDL